MSDQIYITGRGVVSCLGSSVGDFNANLFDGRSRITNISDSFPDLKFTMGAPVADFDPTEYFSQSDLNFLDPSAQFALIAARQAIVESKLDFGAVDKQRIGVVIGTANGGQKSVEDGYRRLLGTPPKRVHPMTVPKTMASGPGSRVASEFGFRGPCFAVSSACASANHAVTVALQLLRGGVADAIVTGGTDFCFHWGYLKAWESLQVVASETCRPFSRGRDGLIIGEGAAIFVLESGERASKRGAPLFAELLGTGMSNDAGNIIAPDRAGMIVAMRSALADANIQAAEVDYVNAHGTGTVANDREEVAAILDVFGLSSGRPAISSTKSIHGHAMGASPALELMAVLAAMERETVPPTLNYLGPAEDCPIDLVVNSPKTQRIETAVSNSFAFGGLNSTLVLRAGPGIEIGEGSA